MQKRFGSNIVKFYFWPIAKAFANEEYKILPERLEKHNKSASDWIKANKPETWAASQFTGETYGHITSNMAETFNKFLHVFVMLESIRILLMKLFCDRRYEALNSSKEATPYAEGKIAEAIEKSKDYNVYSTSATVYEALFILTGRSIYQFCDPYYNAENYRLAYQDQIDPVLPDSQQGSVLLESVISPIKRRRVGRPKVKRRRSKAVKEKKVMHCSIYKESGHTKKRCDDATS
ncbi:hypothetical protein GIB67_023371 [Kingdonia uniflora]|uniref:Uncharacterized protein n=1 Tax=Kingdonia uniflora TaxID=39325 RepID=A0A7J7LI68_9MAGN|nr:hypothetical protein GIB67_023371 [Kingdonia uniflora]